MLFREPSMNACNNEVLGNIDSFESFGSVDGPGIRFIVFLAGCPLRCLYCHNPETWSTSGSKQETAAAVLKQAMRYRPYWKGGGGITVSGGEPMLQMEFVTELFRLAKAEGISTCLDTSGAVFTEAEPQFSKINALLSVTDLLLLDIKHIDSEQHKKLTGKANANILAFAKYLAKLGKPVWIRHVLVPGINDDEASLAKLSDFIAALGNVERVEVLPYHRLALPKYADLGIKYPIPDIMEPSSASVAKAKKILQVEKYQKYQKK